MSQVGQPRVKAHATHLHPEPQASTGMADRGGKKVHYLLDEGPMLGLHALQDL